MPAHLVHVYSLPGESGSHMADNRVGHALNIVLLDFLGAEGSAPDERITNGRHVRSLVLRGKVRAWA